MGDAAPSGGDAAPGGRAGMTAHGGSEGGKRAWRSDMCFFSGSFFRPLTEIQEHLKIN